MRHASQIILAVAVLAAVAGGTFLLVRQASSGGRIEIVLPTATADPEADLQVYVSGAVRAPGVYSAKEGDRLIQIIQQAGGATQDADLTAVNLAVRLKDQDHWHIPVHGESPIPPAVRSATGPEVIDINSADVEQLKSLPGIGELKAESIVRFRETNGPYASVEDLLAVRGIGPATLDAIRDLWRCASELIKYG